MHKHATWQGNRSTRVFSLCVVAIITNESEKPSEKTHERLRYSIEIQKCWSPANHINKRKWKDLLQAGKTSREQRFTRMNDEIQRESSVIHASIEMERKKSCRWGYSGKSGCFREDCCSGVWSRMYAGFRFAEVIIIASVRLGNSLSLNGIIIGKVEPWSAEIGLLGCCQDRIWMEGGNLG